MDMSHAANCLATLRKVEDISTFLATRNATFCCRCRGCYLQCPRWKSLTTLSPPAWNLLRAKNGLWLLNFHKIAWQVAMDMSHAANCLATLRKVEDISTFLATRNATFCCRCRGCYLQCPRWKSLTTLSPPAWNLLRAKNGLWLPNFHKIAWQVAMDMSHAENCLATLRKVEDISTFLATRNATFCRRSRGCYTWNPTYLATFVARHVARKIASCNMAF